MKLGEFKTVKNRGRKFGSLKQYVIGKILYAGGELKVAFTETEINRAMNRAIGNPEDFAEKTPR